MQQTSMTSTVTPAGRAYDFARWAILSSVYEAGDVITESALAHEIGVDCPPAREALLRLQYDGLVSLHPGRGAVVSSYSVADVEDVLEARELVENHTAPRSFANRAALLPAVERVHAEMRQRRRERDTARFTECDRRFHELIVDAADNTALSSVYRMLRERQSLFTSAMVRGRADRMDAVIAEHEKILDTLRGDDMHAFTEAVNGHLRWSANLAHESR
jgi:DNA-binding GntR family transcriptional regulator